MRTAYLPALLLIMAHGAIAQITPIGNYTGVLYQLRTLESAGMKLVNASPNETILIKDLDLNPYLSIAIPPLSPPYLGYGFGYITESLFDTDPTTIEYIRTFQDTSSDLGPLGFEVRRQDGTLLFSKFPGYLAQGLNEPAPIFNTPSGTYMLAREYAYGPGTLYLLPGHLPCLDCNGGPAAVEGLDEQFRQPQQSLFDFPDPNQGTSHISYVLPEGTSNAQLAFFNSGGALVKKIPIRGPQGTITVTLSDLPSGTYSYWIETATGPIGAERMILMR